MVAAFVATRASGFSADVGTVTSAAFTPTAGNLLVCALICDAGQVNYVTGITSAKGNTWTRATSQNGGTVGNIDVWTCPVGSGGSGETISFGYNQSAATSVVYIVQECSGVDLASPVDKISTINNSANNATTHTTAATAATAQADEIVFGVFGHDATSSRTWTLGSGFTNLGNAGGTTSSAMWGAMESKVVAATGTQQAAISVNSGVGASIQISGLVVTIKGATAAASSGAFFQFLRP